MLDYFALSGRRPETRVLAAISGLWMSHLVGVASRVGIFDALASGARRPDEIAREYGLAVDPLARALNGLAHLGLVRVEGLHFSLTEDGRLMLPNAVGGLRHMAALWHNLFSGAWAEFETTLRTGEPGFTVRHGEPIFARIARDPIAAKWFEGAMRGLAELITPKASELIAERIHELGCATICDVGGGNGHLIGAIARICPDVECKLLDLPHVVNSTGASLKRNNIGAFSGSFFEEVPQADAHILSNVLHDWPDEDAHLILQHIRKAQRKNGRLFLLEMMLGGETEPLLARSTDLNMLVLTGGRERSMHAFEALLRDAGYRVVSVRPIVDMTCLLEAAPIKRS
jgi:hypothetical protein